MSELANLYPESVWRYFDEITRVPRPSKKEAKIIAYLIDFARKQGLEYKQDTTGNVVILKAASAGMGDRPTVILQSHMDMVTEKNGDVNFDFDNDPIQAYVEKGWVKARGTTLGADCGIGMAAMLAILADDNIRHPQLECLFTVDEETGLTGAYGLADNMLGGKYLINLDSEDEGEIFIGCAGGIDTCGYFSCRQKEPPKNYTFYRIDLKGLLGGHSGDDIDKGRGNSNKLLNRFLLTLDRELDMRLTYFDGGNLRNAIPREAYAIFGIPTKLQARFNELFTSYEQGLKSEYKEKEPDLSVVLSDMPEPGTVLDLPTQQHLLRAICGLPNGVIGMSYSMPGLVETSTNLASVKFVNENSIVLTTSQRSSIESAKADTAAAVESVLLLAGAEVSHSEGYPGWTPNPESYLLEVTRNSYRQLFSEEPKVRAIHAGLECGLFMQKFPWLEMVSFGPTLRGVHSPDERLDIATVDKFWKLLLRVLETLD